MTDAVIRLGNFRCPLEEGRGITVEGGGPVFLPRVVVSYIDNQRTFTLVYDEVK